MEIGSRVSIAGVYVWYATYIGNDKLGRIYLTYLATIIQFVLVKCQNVNKNVARTYLFSYIEF